MSAAPEGSHLSAADRYIVVLEDGADAVSVSRGLGLIHGLSVGHVYTNALQGFAAVVPPARLAALRADPRVVSVQADAVVSIDHCKEGNKVHGAHCDPTTTTTTTTSTTTTTTTSTTTTTTTSTTTTTTTSTTTTTTTSTTTTTTSSTTAPPSDQTIPTGVERINGPGAPVAVGVAVIDTGIDVDHPDLNVAGGYNCAPGRASKYNDGHGHGTHVGGTIGALDNGIGVVGVAPGVPLYAVRVLNNNGMGFRSDVICGIDWVAGNTDLIGVANMSLGGSGSDDGKSCELTGDAYKKAICNAVEAGVTFAVAAGNASDDAANHVPAAYDMVITVSALADFNGAAGGGAAATCRSDVDDTFADFSNYGADVDIIAPGVCILSTWLDGGYYTISGTSMASPHVAGAAALYLSTHPGTSPAAVQSALETAGNLGWDNTDDPDGVQEPLLDVGSL